MEAKIIHRSTVGNNKNLFINSSSLIDFAGDGLCAYLIKSGRQDAAVALCRQVASRAQHAVWAWKRLGMLWMFPLSKLHFIKQFQYLMLIYVGQFIYVFAFYPFFILFHY